MKISYAPFFKTTPYFTNPSLFMGKVWTPSFRKNFENATPPPPYVGVLEICIPQAISYCFTQEFTSVLQLHFHVIVSAHW